MNEDKTQELKKKYPKIFKENFWFEHADGWYDLIDNLCYKIQSYIDDFDHVEQAEATQVKEKFGYLRFYIYGGDDFIHKLIDEAEGKSGQICEACGAPGTVKKLGGYWLMCRCQPCYDKDLEDRNNRISQK
jgi:hypothetical protein